MHFIIYIQYYFWFGRILDCDFATPFDPTKVSSIIIRLLFCYPLLFWSKISILTTLLVLSYKSWLRPNTTSQNRLVRWGYPPLNKLWLGLIQPYKIDLWGEDCLLINTCSGHILTYFTCLILSAALIPMQHR